MCKLSNVRRGQRSGCRCVICPSAPAGAAHENSEAGNKISRQER